jgi:hypothetical protein
MNQRALIHELALRGVSAKAQVSFPICYKEQYLGEYVADLVVGEHYTGVLSSYFVDTTVENRNFVSVRQLLPPAVAYEDSSIS